MISRCFIRYQTQPIRVHNNINITIAASCHHLSIIGILVIYIIVIYASGL